MLINQRLTELAGCIAKDERKDFFDFLDSPFLNKSATAKRFCKFLVDTAYAGTIDTINEKKLRAVIFGGAQFNKKNFGNHCTNARKLFEHYLILRELEKRAEMKSGLLLEGMVSRKLFRSYDSFSVQAERELQKNPYHDLNYYSQSIAFKRLQMDRKGIDIETDLSKDYRLLSGLADRQFSLFKLQIVNSMLSRKYHVLGIEKEKVTFLDEVMNYVEENREQIRKNDIALFSEYLILKMMSSEDNERYFHELFEHISSNFRRYSQEGLELVYYPLVNYGSNRAALGDSVFLNYVFRIYVLFEKNGYYTRLKSMQDLDFISVIIISLRVGKVRWAENFRKKYISKLSSGSLDDNESLAKGLTAFARKKYSDAVEHIGKVNYINSYYYLKSKETLIKIYYETSDMIALMPVLDTTRHYLKRRKSILSIHYKRYMDFLKCVGILVRSKKDPSEAFLLKDELRKNKNMISSDWISEKMHELKHKY